MGFGSQSGQVIIRTQAVQGTFQADLPTAGIGLKLRSGSLGTNRDLLIPDPEIGGGRDTTDAYLGAVAWSGDYEFYTRLNAMLTLFAAGFGSVSAPTAVETGVKKFTVTPLDSSALPFLSIEERIGSGLECFRYTDAVVNTLHLEAEANGYLQGTAGIIAALQTAGATPSDASTLWDNTNLIVGTNITVTYNGVQLPAKSFNFDLTNNFEDDDFGLGSLFLKGLTGKGREVTSSFTIRPQDSTLFRQASYGATSATTAGGLSTKAPLVIEAKTYEKIGATAVGTLKLTMPNFVLSPHSFDPSGDDVIETDIEGRAVRPAAGTPVCTAEFTVSQQTVA